MPLLPDRAEVVVIGAGLSGLAAARAVHRAGRGVVVIEASNDVGGRVRSDVVDGFRLDRGFQVLLTAYPELDTQLDVPALALRRFDAGALVWHDRRFQMVGDPFRRPTTLPASLVAKVGTPFDKVRAMRLRRRLMNSDVAALLRSADGSTLEALRSAGFSEQMITRFFRPLLGSIQLDPTLGASRRMFDVLFRTLARGDSAVPAGGMGAITRQLASRLPPDRVVVRTAVAAIDGNTVIAEGGRRVHADKVIVATEGPVASRLVNIGPVGSRAVTSVWFAADAPPTTRKLIILNGTGSGEVLNVAVMTNVAPEYSSDGRALIVASCPGVCDAEAGARTRAQLRGWWGSDVDRWQHLRTDAIAHAQPDHVPPHSPKQRVHLEGDLFVCGDHRDTGSIQGALFSGRRCGEAVVAALAAATSERT